MATASRRHVSLVLTARQDVGLGRARNPFGKQRILAICVHVGCLRVITSCTDVANSIPVHLREYPMAFARKLVRMAPGLIRTCQGRPLLPPEGVPSALETFRGMSYGEHDDLFPWADFGEIFVYLRGGDGLRFPSEEWKALLPKNLARESFYEPNQPMVS